MPNRNKFSPFKSFHTPVVDIEIEQLADVLHCTYGGRAPCLDRLDQGDDNYAFVEIGMRRWADRGYRDPAWDHIKRS